MASADSCPVTDNVATIGASVSGCLRDRPPRVRSWTSTMRPRHLPYLLILGRKHVVLSYPETRPYMTFLFVGPQFYHPASSKHYLTIMLLP